MTTTFASWIRHRTTHLAIWPDAYVAGLRDGERAGRVAIGLHDESSGLIAELVGHLASLLMQLNIWRRGLAQERPLEEWLPVCRDMLNAFFLPDAETEAAMTLIEQQRQAIIAEGLGAQYGDAVPLSLLRDELAQRLDQERISQRFLAGPVNIS
ncbi:hypothetical protein ACLB1M_21940 [Escherichia coli]